jgi:glycosyltransferase involved in cell wall biosynthesis
MKIAIIVPCLNEEKFIMGCLESVFAFILPTTLEYEPIIYIVDGGSTDTDTTRTILSEIKDKHLNIHILNNPQKISSSAVNIGVKAAGNVDYIMRLDAHCIYPNDYLVKCRDCIWRQMRIMLEAA